LESGREEEAADTSIVGHKRKAPYTMDATLSYLLDAVITMDDMMGKVPKLRYADHDVRDVPNSRIWPRTLI